MSDRNYGGVYIQMTKSTFTKTKAEMKSSSYYLFWGIATVAVVAGQVYVGTGYRSMSRSLDAWFEQTINIMIKKRIMQEAPRKPEYYRDDMVIR
jgi:hypothetical protein